MKKFMLKLLNSKDREVEAHLVLACLGAVSLIGLSVYHVVSLRLGFDAGAFGEGFGCLMAGGGAAAFGQGLQRAKEGREDDDAR